LPGQFTKSPLSSIAATDRFCDPIYRLRLGDGPLKADSGI
jgi:hypothetical protein